MATATPRIRVAGSAFTVFHWQNDVIAFAEEIAVQSVRPVADAVPVHPLNYTRPAEIITAGAHGAGTLTLTLTELYNASVWQRLSSLSNSQNIVDIMRTMAQANPGDVTSGVTITKYIRPPVGVADNSDHYAEHFYNCMITDVEDNETINIAAMQINKAVTVMFTHSAKMWINGGNTSFPTTIE